MSDPRTQAGPDLIDSLDALERRMRKLENLTQGSILGTDQTIAGSHARLDALLGEDVAEPDGNVVLNLNADLLDGQHRNQIGDWPDAAPANPPAENDEFDTTTLAAKWTESTTAGAHDHSTTIPSATYIGFSGSQSYTLTQSYAPAGAFNLALSLGLGFVDTGATAALVVQDATAANQMAIRWVYEAWGSTPYGWAVELASYESATWTARTTRRITTNAISPTGIILYLRRGTTNDFTGWLNCGGTGWIYAGVYGKALSIAKLQISLTCGNTPTRCALNWLRRDWATL